jgi:hypothetical protein
VSRSDLDAAIHAARPVVATDFVDDVMRRIRVEASNARSRRRLAIGGVVVAVAALVAIRLGEPNEETRVVVSPSVAMDASSGFDAASSDPLVAERGHADVTEMQRCHDCHTEKAPLANAVNIVAFIDLGDASAATDLLELELLLFQLERGVRIDIQLVAASPAAFAARSAAQQSELWSMLERIVTTPDRGVATLRRHGRELAHARRFDARPFDVARFERWMDGPEVRAEVRRAATDARRHKLRTGFVVDSQVFTGADARRNMRAFAIQSARARNLVP